MIQLDKLVEVFDFVGYLLARERKGGKEEELELDPQKERLEKAKGLRIKFQDKPRISYPLPI